MTTCFKARSSDGIDSGLLKNDSFVRCRRRSDRKDSLRTAFVENLLRWNSIDAVAVGLKQNLGGVLAMDVVTDARGQSASRIRPSVSRAEMAGTRPIPGMFNTEMGSLVRPPCSLSVSISSSVTLSDLSL